MPQIRVSGSGLRTSTMQAKAAIAAMMTLAGSLDGKILDESVYKMQDQILQRHPPALGFQVRVEIQHRCSMGQHPG